MNSGGSSGRVGGTGRQQQLGAGGTLNREAAGAFLTDHAAISKEMTGTETLLYGSEPDLYLVNKGQGTKQTYKDKDVSVHIWDELMEGSRQWGNNAQKYVIKTLTHKIKLMQLWFGKTQRFQNKLFRRYWIS